MVTPVESPPEPPESLTDPRELLLGYLDFYRDAVLRKLDGLPEEQLGSSVLPSAWTPLELLHHLTYVETRWVRWGFAAEPVDEPWGDRGPDGRWRVPDGMPAEDVKAAFREACDRSRQIVAAARLDDIASTGGRFDGSQPVPSLAWILFHLLQEYARHVGHLDVTREIMDGVIGE
ncbi:DinB family protein [Actinomadura rudentiformis]|uniref:DinB family protein n=1 Tax=Actinomadura rudentiformis TaxID=359158 RepID=A0A6H9YUU0_9ACTN|nr:DinB family protein [Actinomadura rudentiformis]KAB2343639.1 DinB family protein [Actinomadura rudentiformis]